MALLLAGGPQALLAQAPPTPVGNLYLKVASAVAGSDHPGMKTVLILASPGFPVPVRAQLSRPGVRPEVG